MRLIDADALVEQLSGKAKEMLGIAEQCQAPAINYYTGAKYGFAKAAIIANGLPTIEPKRGKWIRHVLKNANVPWGYDCSACGEWFVVGEDTVEKYDYCPNCGARMERSEE